jgi:hypothetical protein
MPERADACMESGGHRSLRNGAWGWVGEVGWVIVHRVHVLNNPTAAE